MNAPLADRAKNTSEGFLPLTRRNVIDLVRFIPSRLRAPLVNNIIPLFSHQNGIIARKVHAIHAAFREEISNSSTIYRRLELSYRPVSAPLVLISQIQRSGGSLLSQLFDGHSEILAHPEELKIGHPKKHLWPLVDGNLSPERQFEILFEPSTIEMCENGYAKGHTDPDRRNFFFIPAIQRKLFIHISRQIGDRLPRAILDAYFTSYFNSWLNLRSHITRARYVTGFVPLLVNDRSNMDSFWSTYPDGYLISIIRSPMTWFPSAMRLGGGKKYNHIKPSAQRWNESTQAIMNEKARHGDRVIVIHFDDLVTRTADVMQMICLRLDIPFEPILLQPTFNSETMVANTSFDKVQGGVISSAPTKRDKHLSEGDRAYLEKHCMPLYEQALAEVVEALPKINTATERDSVHR